MPHPRRYTTDEVVERGEAIYEREIRPLVEPEHVGKFLVVDIETGAYEIDADELAASVRAFEKNPSGARYLVRVGYTAAHQIGGSISDARR